MRRRDFIILLVGAMVGWPSAVRAQQPERIRRVGVLNPWPENQPYARASVAALGKALADFGWVEGKNIRIDYRFAATFPVPMSPGRASGPRSRRPAGCSRCGRTSRRHALGRDCTGHRESGVTRLLEGLPGVCLRTG